MKEYVEYHACIERMIEEYPVLKKFLLKNNDLTFSSDLINNYIGYKFAEYKTPLTADFYNKLLTKLNKMGKIE